MIFRKFIVIELFLVEIEISQVILFELLILIQKIILARCEDHSELLEDYLLLASSFGLYWNFCLQNFND